MHIALPWALTCCRIQETKPVAEEGAEVGSHPVLWNQNRNRDLVCYRTTEGHWTFKVKNRILSVLSKDQMESNMRCGWTGSVLTRIAQKSTRESSSDEEMWNENPPKGTKAVANQQDPERQPKIPEDPAVCENHDPEWFLEASSLVFYGKQTQDELLFLCFTSSLEFALLTKDQAFHEGDEINRQGFLEEATSKRFCLGKGSAPPLCVCVVDMR